MSIHNICYYGEIRNYPRIILKYSLNKSPVTSYLLTGASSGIGAGTAKMFSQLGAQLAITGRNEENLKKTADECEKLCNTKVFQPQAYLFYPK